MPGVPEPVTGLMVLQALQGLMYLHREMKQMHRDLKPANVMLTKGGTVKLSDFGISKQLESTDSLAVTQCGTTRSKNWRLAKNCARGQEIFRRSWAQRCGRRVWECSDLRLGWRAT